MKLALGHATEGTSPLCAMARSAKGALILHRIA